LPGVLLEIEMICYGIYVLNTRGDTQAEYDKWMFGKCRHSPLPVCMIVDAPRRSNASSYALKHHLTLEELLPSIVTFPLSGFMRVEFVFAELCFIEYPCVDCN